MTHRTGSVPEAQRAADWRQFAACLGQWDAMHPEHDEHDIAHAKSICGRCPVQRECFLDAVATGDMAHGIRAGLRANERRAVAEEIARRRTGAAA